MTEVLVGTASGCHVFRGSKGDAALELRGRSVGPFAPEPNGGCVAIVDQREIWRRSPSGTWAPVAIAGIPLQSLLVRGHEIFAGGMDEAAILRVSGAHLVGAGQIERLRGFDNVPGRSEWFAGGPPLGVRSLAAPCGGNVLLAAVHVGGIPRSEDEGETWQPTLPVMFDVHEVRTHPSRPYLVAAATAVGLCVSHDCGAHWEVLAEGLPITNSLALAVLETDVLFSIQDGPFATQSQIWRWPVAGGALQPVRDGLPEFLEGKVDTAQIASNGTEAALCDGGGNLWLSAAGAAGWQRIATGLGYALGLLIL